MTSPNQAVGRSFSSSKLSQAADHNSPAHSNADEAVLDPYSDAALQRFVQADADLQTALHAYLEAAQAIDASLNRSMLFTRLPPHIVGTYELLTSIATIGPGFSPPQSLTIPSSPSLDAPASNSEEQLILYPSQVPAGPRTHPPPPELRDREPSPSDRWESRKGKRADANASTGNVSLDQNQSAKPGSSKRKAHSPLRRSSRLSKLAKTSTADVVGPGSAAAAAARSVGGDGEAADSEEDAILLAGRRRRHRPVTLTDTDSESDEDDKLDM
ncbi:hypothetical protein OC846_005446 [Tilletia horrida]|uniref:Uncharacterized protein n=1 Tax=Tilletia horrida TaxID=155126 RepID=A0AAN6JQ79_9BASI|nr:hypothetical protein OC846_005446 [Tilletia horrida]KAK0561050.1 hypothetical protein OC861_005998 [Tilletia horrida]